MPGSVPHSPIFCEIATTGRGALLGRMLEQRKVGAGPPPHSRGPPARKSPLWHCLVLALFVGVMAYISKLSSLHSNSRSIPR